MDRCKSQLAMLNKANEACSIELASGEEFNENGSSGLLKDEIIRSVSKFNYHRASIRLDARRASRHSNRRRLPNCQSNRQTGRRTDTLVAGHNKAMCRCYLRIDKRLLFKRKCKKKPPVMGEEEIANQRSARHEMFPNRLADQISLYSNKPHKKNSDSGDLNELTGVRSVYKQSSSARRPAGYLPDGKLDQSLIEKPDKRCLIRKSGQISGELNLDESINKRSPAIQPAFLPAHCKPLSKKPELPVSAMRTHRAKPFAANKQPQFTFRYLLFLAQLLISQPFLFSRALALDICLENCNCIYSKNKFIADCSALALESLPVVSFTF